MYINANGAGRLAFQVLHSSENAYTLSFPRQ